MKILVIPDVHGRGTWKEVVKQSLKEKDTHIVFLGDYVDSFDIGGIKIVNNLREIISIKRKFPDKISLLLGNHDYAYIHNFIQITGFNSAFWYQYRELFEQNRDLFQLAWGYSGKEKYTLFTHAGLTEGYYNILVNVMNDSSSILIDLIGENWKELPLHEFLNYFIDQQQLMWFVSHYRGGSDEFSSILWTDKQELINDNYSGINQVVGHTHSFSVEVIEQFGDTLYFTDASDSKNLSTLCFELE